MGAYSTGVVADSGGALPGTGPGVMTPPDLAPPTVPGRRIVHVALSPLSGVRIAAGIFTAFFLFALARNIPDALTRVTLGVTLALALDPVVTRIQRRGRCSRGVAVAVVGSAAVGLFGLLAVVVGPRAVREARNFSAVLPDTVDRLTSLPVIGGVFDRLDAPDRIRAWASDLPAQLDDRAIGQLLDTLVGGVVAGLTVLVVLVATLADGERLVARLAQLVPVSHRSRAGRAGRVFHRTIGAYFAGSLLVAGLAATFVLTVGLALGVPLAPVAALWVLVVNLIPQIGGALAAGLFTLLGFAASPGTGVACLLLYVIYMNIENHVIQPAVVGNAVDLSAAATMMAALVGGAAAGVPGAILATPLVGTAKALWLELRSGPTPEKRTRRSSITARVRKWWKNRRQT